MRECACVDWPSKRTRSRGKVQYKSMVNAALQDVTEVVNTCHEAGISKLAVKLRPIAVIKG